MIRTFFVLEVRRGKGVLERSLEIAEVLRGVEEGDEDKKPFYTYLNKSLSRLSFNKIKLATNNTLRYDMPLVSPCSNRHSHSLYLPVPHGVRLGLQNCTSSKAPVLVYT